MEENTVSPMAEEGIVNALPDRRDVKNAGKWAQPTDGSTAIVQA